MVVGLESSPLTLDPRLATDAYSTKVSHLIHRGLFRLNNRLEVIPDLVERYEFVAPLTYRFWLKPEVVFHNGRPVTASAVRATLESIRDPNLASPWKSAFDKIAAIRVKNDREFEIELKEPFAPLLSNLTLGIISDDPPDPQVGCGPYQLVEFKPEPGKPEPGKPSERVVLQRNPHYTGLPPRSEFLIFRVIPDDNLRMLELMNGRVDLLLNNVPPLLIEHLRKQSALDVQTTEGINMTYIGFNLGEEPLKKLAVRQALAQALNIPEIIQYRLAGLATPATGILSPIHWAYEGEVKKYLFDPEGARELLDQAGYPDPDGRGPLPRFSLVYKTSTKKDRIGLARLFVRYFKEVGVELKLVPLEWGTLFQDIRTGNFQIFSLTWVGLTEPDSFFTLFHSSQVPPVGANRGRYVNPVIDKLTVEGRRTLDLPDRKEIYSYTQKTLSDDLPYIPLWYEHNVAVYQKRVKGLQMRPDASFEVLVDVYKEAL